MCLYLLQQPLVWYLIKRFSKIKVYIIIFVLVYCFNNFFIEGQQTGKALPVCSEPMLRIINQAVPLKVIRDAPGYYRLQ